MIIRVEIVVQMQEILPQEPLQDQVPEALPIQMLQRPEILLR